MLDRAVTPRQSPHQASCYPPAVVIGHGPQPQPPSQIRPNIAKTHTLSGSLERTKIEVLAAREAFDCVIFVDGKHEFQAGLPVPEGIETLRQFAEMNDGVHYLDGGAGVLIGHTLVCGVAGWHAHQAAMLADRISEAAADQAIGEIVVVT